jgi:hypothetical protein
VFAFGIIIRVYNFGIKFYKNTLVFIKCIKHRKRCLRVVGVDDSDFLATLENIYGR